MILILFFIKNNAGDDKGGAVYASKVILENTPSILNIILLEIMGEQYTLINLIRMLNMQHSSIIKLKLKKVEQYILIQKIGLLFHNVFLLIIHCGDEGGAIYLDSCSSHLTLRYNIFRGNSADDEGCIHLRIYD